MTEKTKTIRPDKAEKKKRDDKGKEEVMALEPEIVTAATKKTTSSEVDNPSLDNYRESANGQMELFYLLSKGDENYSNLVDPLEQKA